MAASRGVLLGAVAAQLVSALPNLIERPDAQRKTPPGWSLSVTTTQVDMEHYGGDGHGRVRRSSSLGPGRVRQKTLSHVRPLQDSGALGHRRAAL